ncbi:MAG: aminoacyl-tRNA hydrolase [Geobacteraceae bacterium]|nr:aminoacyl-tRNA hydrolase [Geobacteraceae bacterium]
MAAKLIVGLGNPGPKYLWTRHNAGFIVLDRFAALSGLQITRKNFGGLYAEGDFKGNRVLLLEPQTFMNLSGRSVAEALHFHKLETSDLIVIHDELDIPFGQIKLKADGGHGGHNGLRSIHQHLGNGNYNRIRVGINKPLHGNVADYVLTNFSKDEMAALPALIDGAVDALEMIILDGLPKAMSLFNNKVLA